MLLEFKMKKGEDFMVVFVSRVFVVNVTALQNVTLHTAAISLLLFHLEGDRS